MLLSGSIMTYLYTFHYFKEKKMSLLPPGQVVKSHQVQSSHSSRLTDLLTHFLFIYFLVNLQLVLAQILGFKYLNFFTLQKAKGVLAHVNFQPTKKPFPLFHSQQIIDISDSPRGTKNRVSKEDFTPLYLSLAILCTSTASKELHRWKGQRDVEQILCFVAWQLPSYSEQ